MQKGGGRASPPASRRLLEGYAEGRPSARDHSPFSSEPVPATFRVYWNESPLQKDATLM